MRTVSFFEVCSIVSAHQPESVTDSTIVPPKHQRFSLTDVLRLLDTGKDASNKTFPYISLFCKGLSNDDVGVSMYTVFQDIRPEAGFKTGGFVKEKLGGLP